MNEMAVERRNGTAGWRTAAWAVGAAVCAAVLAAAVFIAAIVVAESLAFTFGFTEQVGVPVFAAIIALAVVAYGALIHLIVRAVGRSAEVPWVIWPSMALLPAAWVFAVLASGSSILAPIMAVMQLVGLATAFVTLGERRWTKGWAA